MSAQKEGLGLIWIIPHTAVRGEAIYLNGWDITGYTTATFKTLSGPDIAVRTEVINSSTLRITVPENAAHSEIAFSGADVPRVSFGRTNMEDATPVEIKPSSQRYGQSIEVHISGEAVDMSIRNIALVGSDGAPHYFLVKRIEDTEVSITTKPDLPKGLYTVYGQDYSGNTKFKIVERYLVT